MRKIHAQKSNDVSDPRCPLTLDSAAKLIDLGFQISVDPGVGEGIGISDSLFQEKGVRVTLLDDVEPDILIRIQKPGLDEINGYPKGLFHVSYFDPFTNGDLVEAFTESGISAVSLEMIPRTTLAQKMDAQSSQANLAGYFAVIKAAEMLGKILPMMMTPAGTITPARVLIIGVGVAGLQAIATAKRLGAQVVAFDTRVEVEEQVKSLGAKFLKIDLGETEGTDQGYAKELTEEQLYLQRKGLKKACGNADILITTARVFGRPSPQIISEDMLDAMHEGSVVVDLAAEGGGNVAGTKSGEVVTRPNGVKIVGYPKLEAFVAKDASEMLAANFCNFLQHFWDVDKGEFKVDPQDEILRECLIVHRGEVVHERFKS